MVITVEIDDVMVPAALVTAGFLNANDCDNKSAIAAAIEHLIETLIIADSDA